MDDYQNFINNDYYENIINSNRFLGGLYDGLDEEDVLDIVDSRLGDEFKKNIVEELLKDEDFKDKIGKDYNIEKLIEKLKEDKKFIEGLKGDPGDPGEPDMDKIIKELERIVYEILNNNDYKESIRGKPGVCD